MKINIVSSLIIAMFLSSVSFAQKGNKVDAALASFLQTDFMNQFQDIKTNATAAVVSFKQRQSNFRPQDIARVQVGYDKTARRFNQLLDKIKSDFMDPGTAKFIDKYPDKYSKELEFEMYKLQDFYAQNFQQALMDVTGDETDGMPVIILLTQLLPGIKMFVEQMGQMKLSRKKYSESYLQANLIQPNRFRFWNEITSSGEVYNQPGNYDPGMQNQDPYNQNQYDPYNNQNQNTDPYNTNNQDPYNQNNNQNQNQYDPYNQNTNQNQNQYDPYNQNTNQNQNQNQYDPYNQNNNQNQNQNQNQYDPYNQNTNQNQNQNQYDPYNQNNNQNQNTDPYNTNNQNQYDPNNQNSQQNNNYNYDEGWNGAANTKSNSKAAPTRNTPKQNLNGNREMPMGASKNQMKKDSTGKIINPQPVKPKPAAKKKDGNN